MTPQQKNTHIVDHGPRILQRLASFTSRHLKKMTTEEIRQMGDFSTYLHLAVLDLQKDLADANATGVAFLAVSKAAALMRKHGANTDHLEKFLTTIK